MTETKNDIPRIVRGNDFTARVLVTRNVPSTDSEGNKSTRQEGIELSGCNSMVARRVTRLGRRVAMDFAVDGSYVCVPFGEDVPSGSYGLEVAGRFANGQDWRFYLKPGEFLDIVEATSDGYTDGATRKDIYDFTAVILGESLSASQLAELQSAAENANAAADEAAEAAGKATSAAEGYGEAVAEAKAAAASANDAADKAKAAVASAAAGLSAMDKAEAARVAAEDMRVSAENQRDIHEEQRVASESARKEAEDARADAEAGRKDAETSRADAEAKRAEAEEARAEAFGDAEKSRQSAFGASETTRQETFEASEKSRQSAFDAAEAQRQSDYDTLKAKAEAAIGGAEMVDAALDGTSLTVTDRNGEKRSVELVDYNERVTVSVRKTAATTTTTTTEGSSSAGGGTEAMPGATARVVVDEGKETLTVHEYTAGDDGKLTFTVPRGLLYEIFLPSVAGYRYVRTLRFTASLPGRDVEAVYEALPTSPVAEELLDTEVQWKDSTAQECVEGALGKNPTYRELIDMPQAGFESMVAKMKTVKGDSGELLYQKVKCLDEFGLMENVTAVKDRMFLEWSALESVAFPNAVSVVSYAFQNCSSLTSVDLPAVTSVGAYAFQDCDLLSSVSLPAVTSMANAVFYRCDALVSVSVPLCAVIGNSEFRDSPLFKEADLRSVTEIPDNVFAGTQTVRLTLGATPPSSTGALPTGCVVYVPDDAVETYKAATAWASYTIKGWSELPEE